MKSWLAKFRISSALDAGEPLPKSLRRAIAADPELELFTRRTERLGRSLRRPPLAEASMHDSIMRAVRDAAHQRQPRRAPRVGWLAVSASAAALAVVCFLMGIHRPVQPGGKSLDGAVMVLEMSETMPETMPSMVMAPLSDEWARVDHQLQNTREVLLASFP
jgi:ferric-dicitrate binding protein FerR (iron transport regulator)